MSHSPISLANAALLIVDLRNDFLDPKEAYGRAANRPELNARPDRLKPLADDLPKADGWVISNQFTPVQGKGSEPSIVPHLKTLRPSLGKDDFAPAAWGDQLVDTPQPAVLCVEKLAYSALYTTRLEWVLRNTISRSS